MSTENTTDHPIDNLDEFLRDPLSMSDDALQALVGGQTPAADAGQAAPAEGGPASQAGAANQGDTTGAAPSTDAGAAEKHDDAVVQARDGKNVIPYHVLASEREQRMRAELMVRDLTDKLAQDQQAAAAGTTSRSKDLTDIVDPDLLAQLREEAPQVAHVMDQLIGQVKTMGEQLETSRPAAEEARNAQREHQVQSMVTVEDAITASPKLSHLRTHDPATFNEIADIDSMLRGRAAWKEKPLAERFDAALRMFEAERGAIELPGAKVKAPPAQQPADTAARVNAAIAKATATATGPSTLSDIPGGQPAAESQSDAMSAMSATALTEQFMNMSPEEIEAQLARLAS